MHDIFRCDKITRYRKRVKITTNLSRSTNTLYLKPHSPRRKSPHRPLNRIPTKKSSNMENTSDTRSSRRHGPPEISLLLRLLGNRQNALCLEPLEILLTILVSNLVNLIKLCKLEGAVVVDGWTHISAAWSVLGALEGIVAGYVGETGLNVREGRGIGICREGVPAVPDGPEA